MDARGSERLSMAQRADADRKFGTSILLTMVVALVLGVSAGALLLAGGPVAVGSGLVVLGGLAVAGAAAGLIGVQALHVWQLVDLDRWVLPVGVDALLLVWVVLLLIGSFPGMALGLVSAFALQSIGRVSARSGAQVTSWEVELDDSRVRFRRMVFSAPRGDWHSVSLEEARPRVWMAGRDAYLEIDGIRLPVGAADEQAALLAQEIAAAARRRAVHAEGERAEDRAAVEQLASPSTTRVEVVTHTPVRIELAALVIALVLGVGLLLLGPPVVALFAFAGTLGLRSAAWMFGTRLAQRSGAWPSSAPALR